MLSAFATFAHARSLAAAALCAAALTSLASLACAGCANHDSTEAEAGPADAQAPFDLCDAFTGVGTACPGASPLVCFPMCEAGGCSCSESPDGPRWGCVTDVSCQPSCAPIEGDACDETSTGMAGPDSD
ncbi:MAG TPA: hypothetical protein VK762_20620 [Polyangiaceae bacterium]|nr:hypothetical protein [Polyangiaceae bacterium]